MLKFPEAVSFTQKDMDTIPKEKLVWLEKTDGIRKKIVIEGGFIKEIVRGSTVKIGTLKDHSRVFAEFILDCEYLDGKYFVFDNAMKGKRNFIQRMEALTNLPDPFFKKEYFPVTDYQELFDFINNETSPKTGNKIDGVILQRIDTNFSQKNSVFKLKRRVMNTVDFYVFDNNLYTFPQRHEYRLISTEYDLLRVHDKELRIFSSPFYDSLNTYAKPLTINDAYFESEKKAILELSKRDLNGKVVEFSLNNQNKWLPFRIREDKGFPNGGFVAFSNVSVCFAPLKPTTYFQRIKETPETIAYHDASHKVREIIMRETLSIKSPLSVLDLCGGRGGDYKLFPSSVESLFVLDSDAAALVQYAGKISQQNQFLNIIQGTLSENNDDLLTKITSREEYDNGFDLILMNFAIHYLCDDDMKIRALAKFVKSLLSPSGLFVISYHDGDLLVEQDVEIVRENSENGAIIAKVPMPTIDETGYREEPLALSDFIYLLENEFDVVKDFYPAASDPLMKNVRVKMLSLS